MTFYPLFIIATLNRETTCFLTLAYLCTAWGRERPSQIALHILSQALIWVAIKHFLYLVYIFNERDSIFYFSMVGNIEFLRDPRAYPQFFSSLGYLWLPTLLFWRLIPDPFVKRTVLVIPAFFLGMFFVGNMYEIRVYGELISIVLSAFLLILKELFLKETTSPAP